MAAESIGFRGLETVPQALWNRGVWGDLARSDNARVLDAVSPEQERFQLGQVRTFTNDYIHLILGGVHSRWTTVKLAEVYSRLVMNRPVSATMLAGPEIAAGGHLDGLDPEVRRRLLGAMENVVLSENGTANQIRGVIGQLSSDAPGETIRIFAKTGTPSIAPTQDSATRTLMAELARRHEVIIDFANLPDVKHSGESRAEAFQRILRSDASLAGMGVSAKTLEGELMRGRRLQSARIGESIIQGNSVLWPVSTETDDEHGNGKVFVMVVARYCKADDAREKPVAALTLAINFQAYGGGYKPTLDMVNNLFKSGSMLRSRLMEKRSQCSAPRKPQHGSPR
jgi:hypothetical protein